MVFTGTLSAEGVSTSDSPAGAACERLFFGRLSENPLITETRLEGA